MAASTSKPQHTPEERSRAWEALRKYGYQSQSYNILLPDKRYFFSSHGIDGVIAYVPRARVALVAGDPICAPGDIQDFVAEFIDFCRQRGWRCTLQAVTRRCHDALQEIRFGFLKIGEEPFHDLDNFSLDGGDFRDMRRDIRRARNDGMTVVEYRPERGRNPAWEADMEALSREWAEAKGSGEFSFLVGAPSLEEPGDRKFFLAVLNDGVEAFLICNPIYARNGMYFDILRRKSRPVRGTVELLVTESFGLLREQGYEIASLGTAPLSNEQVEDPAQSAIVGLALELAFDHLNYFYAFKPTFEFKEQFGPDRWEPRWLAYYPNRFNPIIIYALLKAYDPAAVTTLLQKQLGAAWDGLKWLSGAPQEVVERVLDLGGAARRLPGGVWRRIT